jgi:putative membrane protein
MRLSAEERARVAAAVTAAEARSAGEIVIVVAPQSDKYHDAALQWSVLALFVALGALAAWPSVAGRIWTRVTGGWDAPPPSAPFLVALVLALLAFLLARLLLAWAPLRLLLTPGATKTRRVRRHALALFRVGAERRTRARTGVLLYLSLAERRAELVADAAIHGRVAPDSWGAAMHALVAEVRHGRAADGLVAAVEQVGALLAEHFPRAADDTNELPDRVVEL